MNSLLAKLLGLDAAQLADAEWSQLSVRFLGLPTRGDGAAGWLALAMLGVVGALAWWTIRNYRSESAAASPRLRATLASLRLGALGIVLLALFQPALVIDKSKRLPSTVVVLVDDSGSMGLGDHYDTGTAQRLAAALGVDPPERLQTMTRREIAQSILERQDHAWLRELRRRHKLKVMAFSDTARELALSEDAAPTRLFDAAQLTASGVVTDIEAALREVFAGAHAQPLAAVVLLSDGQANAGDAAAGARLAAARNTPLFTLGLGSAEPPRNIEVLSLAGNEAIFKDDEAVFTAQIVARGFEGRTAQLILKQRDASLPSAGEEIVARQPIVFAADDVVQEVLLRVRPTRVGLFSFAAEVELQAEEVTGKDNAATSVARVIDQKVRVLFVAGDSGREYRYLKNYLIRDKTLATQVWLQNASAEAVQEASREEKPLGRLPREEAELFAYDVVLLYDPQPRDFDAAGAQLLRRFVNDRGGGLCFVAGNKYTEDFLFTRDLEPIAALLPVVIERDSLAFREGISRINLQVWPLILTPAGLGHPATQLDADPARNRNLWAAMPGFYWAQPVARAKPGATVLAAHSDPRRVISDGPMPIVATQFYGPGRVMFVGMDATWRWRYVGARYYEQFWGQTLRYLSHGRLLGGRKRVELQTDRESYNLGQRAQITAKVFTPDFAPASIEEFEVELRHENGETTPLTLRMVPGSVGRWEGSVTLEKTGLIEIAPRAASPAVIADPQLAERAATRHIRVLLPRLEFRQPRMNASLLAELAQTTGGRFLAAHEFARVPSLIPSREQILLNESILDLWDAPLWLLLFCALLFSEWGLRKWKNMA